MNIRSLPPICLCCFTTSAGAVPGNVDGTFNPVPNGETDTIVIQPDRKLIVAGNFSRMGGVSRGQVARLHPDGTLDTAFNPDSNGFLRCTSVQADGNVLITGLFTTMGGVPRNYAARVMPDGSLDSLFNPNANNDTYCAAIQPGGGVILGGTFTAVGGTPRGAVARFLPAGTLDPLFNSPADANVRTVLPLPDGRTLISGNFTTVAGIPRGRVAMLTASGALDTSFNSAVDGPVYSSALQADGKILIGGLFTSVGGLPRTNFARLMANGTPDNSFNVSVDNIVRTIAVQANSEIIIGGQFTTVGSASRSRLAKLQSDGTHASNFTSPAVSGGTVFAVTLQADGKIVLAGLFSTVSGLSYPYLARLNNDEPTETLTVLSNSLVRWFRAGAAPETHHVTFDVSTDGGTVWTPLGSATRITAGWELNGLNLPSVGRMRARARTSGGYGGASSGLMETVVSYTVDPLIGWRLANFSTSVPAGPAANNADPDNDGLENLVEYAFGRNPNLPDAPLFPEWIRDDDLFLMAFTRPPNVNGITYTAEYSPTMAPGSWTPAENAATSPQYTFVVPATSTRLYLRTRIAIQ